MANITLFVPDELKKRMNARTDVRWSRAIRNIIERELDDFEEVDRALRKSKFTEKDLAQLTKKVDEDTRRFVRSLANEGNG